MVDDTCFVFFFFQAEDGIRDLTVTGVQTCALPISSLTAFRRLDYEFLVDADITELHVLAAQQREQQHQLSEEITISHQRSEERRVGKECRSRWARYH